MAFIRNVDKLIEGLENKFFTEARAKAALAPELASEQSARQAGDAAEAAAREAADNALDARLDVIEGSGEGSVAKAEQDAKDYADQKVAALVNSAPAVLDTLKELSDALGSDPNFATTVSNQIGVVDAKVAQEILDRASAVSAEQSARESADQALDGRLDVLEQDPTTKTYVDGKVSMLQGEASQSVSNLEAAIEAEESARELADSNLSGRIAVLEQDPVTKVYVDGEVSDLQGQITQEISNRQSAVSSEQQRAEGAEQALDGRLGILEQDPTTKTYVDQEVSAEESRAMSAESALDGRIDVLEQDPTTKTYVDGKVVMLQGEVDSEESRAMQAESALDGRLDILEQDPTTKTYVDGEVLNVQNQISQEILDRQAEGVSLAADIHDEEVRALAAEDALDGKIDQEIFDRSAADSLLDGRLDALEADPVTKSYVDSEMSSEEQRAMGAEAALDSRLDILEQDPTTKAYVDGIQSALDSRLDVLESDPVTKAYVDGEVSDLQGQVNTEKGRIDAILSAADADKDSFAEIVNLINSVDASNDSAFAGYVLSNDAALAQEISDRQADVNAEEQRAMAAEGLLDGRLDVLESDPTTKTYVDGEVSDLQGQITQEISNRQADVNAEESRAMAAEALLDGRLDVLETDPTTKTYVDGKFSTEQSARQSADTALQSNIDAEAAARSAEDLTMFKKDGSRPLTGDITTSSYSSIGNWNNYFNEVHANFAHFVDNVTTGRVIFYNDLLAGAGDGTGIIGKAPWGLYRPSELHIKNIINLDSLTASKVLVSDANKNLVSSNISSTELGYLSGLSSNAQTQLDSMFKKDGSRNLEGNLLFSAETFNIGASAANRPSNIYVKTSIVNAGSESIGTTLTMAGASGAHFKWTTDGAGDIGASGANRPNTIYAKTLVSVPTISTNTISSSVTFSATATCSGKLMVNGGIALRYTQKAVDYTVALYDYLIAVSDLSVSRVMTLPSAVTAGVGFTLVIKDQTGSASQTKYIQIAPQSGQTIDGQNDYKIVMPYESVMLVSNGSNWFII